MNIAYFISSHGFGHATRATAIMAALRARDPEIRFEIFTGTPEWLFRDAGLTNYTYHPGAVDVGLVQRSPMEHDLPKTIEAVERYLDEIPHRAEELSEELKRCGAQAVLCDISPLGIVTGKLAGLPVLLFENFTWDWIYEPYIPDYPAFSGINSRYREIFSMADHRMQSDPLCDPDPDADILIPPVSRSPRHSAAELRKALGIPGSHRIGLISMGGIPENLDAAVDCAVPENVTLLLPGTFEKVEFLGNKVLLPHHSGYYHPDMVHAADFVIGKTGYSTIGEVCASGSAYGFISRENFRESGVTTDFLRRRPNTFEIAQARFDAFTLDEEITRLLDLGKIAPLPVNGSDVAADFILRTLRAA
ncbi:MAG: hypothetical protein IJI07_11260 [Flexilinea sp.]|nr:hypothetical protein [Flexilinea sp.]